MSPERFDEDTCCDLWPFCECEPEEADEADFEPATCDEDGYQINGYDVSEAAYWRYHYDPEPRG